MTTLTEGIFTPTVTPTIEDFNQYDSDKPTPRPEIDCSGVFKILDVEINADIIFERWDGEDATWYFSEASDTQIAELLEKQGISRGDVFFHLDEPTLLAIEKL